MENEPKGQLDLLLLSVLQSGPAHGYAVIAALRDQSDGAFDLQEGTVYPALHRLERRGLVASGWTEGAGRRRRVYELTPAGTAALRTRREEWRRFSMSVHTVVGWVG